MSAALEAEWVFEPGDPEVGIFGDLVLHTCEANVEEEPGLIVDQSLRTHGDLVDEVTTVECPACKATTSTTDTWPKSYFEEPGR